MRFSVKDPRPVPKQEFVRGTRNAPAATSPELASSELDALLAAFSADPSDEGTFRRLDLLLRGAGRWEIVPDDPARTPPAKRI